mmetsp:Transcript_4423/g.10249  ORF Transcript_4423/g.10249 Transcript_4423/m.10249 type:complete len:735 (-) Transcript_4423:225-2429(-)
MAPVGWCLRNVHVRDHKIHPLKPRRSAQFRCEELHALVHKAAHGSLQSADQGFAALARFHWKRSVSNESADRFRAELELRVERSRIVIRHRQQTVRMVPLLLADMTFQYASDGSQRFVLGVAPSEGEQPGFWLFDVGPCSITELYSLLACLGSNGALRRDFHDCFELTETILGTGGCGRVFLGNSKRDLPPVSRNVVSQGRQVALKEVTPRKTPLEDLIRSEIGFLTEAHGHPNVAAMFGVFCSRAGQHQSEAYTVEWSESWGTVVGEYMKNHDAATLRVENCRGETVPFFDSYVPTKSEFPLRFFPKVLDGHRWFIVLELYPNGDLFDFVTKHGAMKEADAVEVMLGLLSALAHLHNLGLVHRDVKCENILLAESGVVLADFGIAAHLGKRAEMEKRVGSPGYAAPEVLTGEPYDEKVDVFAAGVVLYFVLSGVLPFADSSVERILARTVRCKVRMARDKFPNYSGGILKLAKTLLLKDQYQRPAAKRAFYALWTLMGKEERRSEFAKRSFQAVPTDDKELGFSGLLLPGIPSFPDSPALDQIPERADGGSRTLEDVEKLVKTEPTTPSTPTAVARRLLKGVPHRSLMSLGPSNLEEEREHERDRSTRASKHQAIGIDERGAPSGSCEGGAGVSTSASGGRQGSIPHYGLESAGVIESSADTFRFKPAPPPVNEGTIRKELRRFVAALQGSPRRVAKSVSCWRSNTSVVPYAEPEGFRGDRALCVVAAPQAVS